MLWLLLAQSASLGADAPADNGSSEPERLRRRGPYVHDPSSIVKAGTEYWFFFHRARDCVQAFVRSKKLGGGPEGISGATRLDDKRGARF
jgi:hypothetical protein